MAKLAEDFYAVPPGEIYPVLFLSGEDVTGEIEEMARKEGKIQLGRKAAKKAPENK